MIPKAILLVEDNDSDIELTRRALKRSRISNELVVVEDGQDALEFLYHEGTDGATKPNELPALILLDLQLPRVSGLEVLRRIKGDNRTKHLPVVVLTTSNEEQDIAQCYTLGVNSYIRKPVDFVQFAEAIEQVGLYWLVLNVAPDNSE